jgi:hypothetical protein
LLHSRRVNREVKADSHNQMKKLMLVAALALITASVAQSGMVIRRVSPEGALSQISTNQFMTGQTYRLVVYQKNHEQKVYSGVFIGYAIVKGVRKTPTDGVVLSSGKDEAVNESAGKVYYLFRGPHTVLLYRANVEWLIVQSV